MVIMSLTHMYIQKNEIHQVKNMSRFQKYLMHVCYLWASEYCTIKPTFLKECSYSNNLSTHLNIKPPAGIPKGLYHKNFS